MVHDRKDMPLTDVESLHKSREPSLQEERKEAHATTQAAQRSFHDESATPYRLYKRRYVGAFGFVVLSMVTAMSWPWFGPISNNAVDRFGISLNQVNWLGNMPAFVYLPVAILVPIFCSKWGMRRCCDIGVITLLISAWVRYAGTARTLSSERSYALLLLGQFFGAVAQPIFQILAPMYSERWFDLKERTTATMIISIANPVGGALGQLISPIPANINQSILILAIISTASVPFVFLIGEAPPLPPTYAGSRKPQALLSLVRAMLGRQNSQTDLYGYMTVRERIDFMILFLIFGVIVGATNSFAILTAEIFEPVGYSSFTSGLMGAILLFVGLASALTTAPLFDRVFTHHLALVSKVFVPIIAVAWLSLIWTVKRNDIGGLYVNMAILGAFSIPMLPVALELGCELTRNASGSSALLWFSGSVFIIIFILVQGALRALPTVSPPLNMHKALIFNGVFIVVSSFAVLFIRGTQTRRENDERIRQERQEQAR